MRISSMALRSDLGDGCAIECTALGAQQRREELRAEAVVQVLHDALAFVGGRLLALQRGDASVGRRDLPLARGDARLEGALGLLGVEQRAHETDRE